MQNCCTFGLFYNNNQKKKFSFMLWEQKNVSDFHGSELFCNNNKENKSQNMI